MKFIQELDKSLKARKVGDFFILVKRLMNDIIIIAQKVLMRGGRF